MIYSAYAAAAHEVLFLCNALAADEHVTAFYGDRAADNIQKRGFTAAVAADHGDKLAVINGKAEVIKQLQLRDASGVIYLAYVSKLKHGLSPLPCVRIIPAPAKTAKR